MPRLVPASFGMTLLIAAVTAINPLGTDMYLPALPAIRDSLGASTAQAQATLSAFLIGAVAAQLTLGPLSDRYGRRPLILIGLGLFCLGSAVCALANSIEMLVLARVVQSIGGAGASVVGRAMIRDMYDGWAAGREFARINSFRGLVPLICPVIGALLTAAWSWRANFALMVAMGVALALFAAARLPETMHAKPVSPFSVRAMLEDFGQILRNRSFQFHAAVNALVFSGFFSYLSGSAFVLQGPYGLTPLQYAFSFSLVVAGYITGSMLAQRFQASRSASQLIRAGVALATVSSAVVLALMASQAGGAPAVVAAMALYAVGMAVVMPFCDAGALAPFPDKAGSAASLSSNVHLLTAAVVGLVLGRLLDTTPLALPMVLLASSGLAMLLFEAGRKRFSSDSGAG